MKNFCSKISVLIFFTILSLITAETIFAQSAVERATRETDLLGQDQDKMRKSLVGSPSEESKPKIEEKKLPAPKEGEQKFLVKKIVLNGCKTFLPDSFDSILKKYEDRELTITDLSALGKEIEKEYLRRGVIAATFLPEQKSTKNIITLEIIESKMGQLEIQDAPFFKKKRLSRYWKIPQGNILRYDLLSKSVQLMNKNPDREVKATLKPGKEPGTTDIVLTPKTNFPAHVFMSYDNDGAISTGRSRTGMGVRDNNFLGFDDVLMLGETFGRDFKGKYTYHNLPVGFNGTTFLYGFSYNESSPSKEFSVSSIHSKSYDTTFSVHQDLFRKENYIGEAYLGFAARDKTITQNTGTYSKDCLRVFNIGSTFNFSGFGSSTSISSELNQGINGLGSTSNNNPLASRGAKVTYTKFNLNATHRKILPANMQGNLKFKGQVSSTKLTPQEEFSIGGMDSVRGYPSGDYLADNAALLNADLLIPAFFIPNNWKLPYAQESFKQQTNLFAFFDYGWGMRRWPAVTDEKSVHDIGVGTGFNFSFYNQISLQVGWGFAVGKRPLSEGGKSQFFMKVDFQEKLPQEIKRIKELRQQNKKA